MRLKIIQDYFQTLQSLILTASSLIFCILKLRTLQGLELQDLFFHSKSYQMWPDSLFCGRNFCRTNCIGKHRLFLIAHPYIFSRSIKCNQIKYCNSHYFYIVYRNSNLDFKLHNFVKKLCLNSCCILEQNRRNFELFYSTD